MKPFLALVATALVVAAIGTIAVASGEADDAPGLVLIGIVLIVGAIALGVRAGMRLESHERASDSPQSGGRPQRG